MAPRARSTRGEVADDNARLGAINGSGPRFIAVQSRDQTSGLHNVRGTIKRARSALPRSKSLDATLTVLTIVLVVVRARVLVLVAVERTVTTRVIGPARAQQQSPTCEQPGQLKKIGQKGQELRAFEQGPTRFRLSQAAPHQWPPDDREQSVDWVRGELGTTRVSRAAPYLFALRGRRISQNDLIKLYFIAKTGDGDSCGFDRLSASRPYNNPNPTPIRGITRKYW